MVMIDNSVPRKVKEREEGFHREEVTQSSVTPGY